MKVTQLLGLWAPWVASSVQGHGLSLPQELWAYQILESFFKPLIAGDQKTSLASLSRSFARSGT